MDSLVVCFFNKHHVVRSSRYVKHLEACKKRHPHVIVKHCPYDYYHVMLSHELSSHLMNCPKRKLIEEPMYVVKSLNRQKQVEKYICNTYTNPFPNPGWHSPRFYKQHIIRLSQMNRLFQITLNGYKTVSDVGYSNNGQSFKCWAQSSFPPDDNIFNFGLTYEETIRKLDGKKKFCPLGVKSRSDIGYYLFQPAWKPRYKYSRMSLNWKPADVDRF